MAINNSKKGQALITAVIFFLFVSLTIVLGITNPVYKEVKLVRDLADSKASYFLAEAGQEDVVYRLINGMTISSSETLILNGNSVVTEVSDLLGGKEITSIGNSNSLIRKIKVNLIEGTGVSFNYGVQAGEGGIEMDQGSRIEGIGGEVGNVYSNGSIEGGNNAVITGDAIVASSIVQDFQASSVICNTDQIVGQSNPEIDFAQSFSPAITERIGEVSLYIKKIGNPRDRDVRIVADNNGGPSDSYLAKGKLKGSLVGTGYAWIDIVFSSPPSVVAGQTYWIILDANKDNNKYWIWCEDSNEGYADGVSMYSEDWDDDPWVSSSGDLTFKIFLGTGTNSISSVEVQGTAKANTITDSIIGADAYYQNISNTTVGGTSYPESPDEPLGEMPISDANITDWKNEAGCGTQPAIDPCLHSGDYNVTEDVNLGPLTITGDLIVNVNNKTLILSGTVYVQGNIDIDNGITIKCDSSYESQGCILITDGWTHVDNNNTFQGSGTTGSYLMILTTLTCTGSSGTNCTHHGGAIDVHNNATGAIFYAPDGMVNLHNGVNITEVTAYKIRLDNNATITYEKGLVDAQFTAGPQGGWEINGWEEVP